MSINRKELTEITDLAQLDLNAAETKQVTESLNQVMDLVERIKNCETTQVEPMFHPFDFWMPLRPDEVTDVSHKKALLALSSHADDDFYLVPKVIE